MSVVHILVDDHDVEVWLDCDGGMEADGLVVGVGRTPVEALDDAEVDLLQALERVRELRAQHQAGCLSRSEGQASGGAAIGASTNDARPARSSEGC